MYRLECLDFQCRVFFGFSPLDEFYPEFCEASSLANQIDRELKKRDRRSRRENGLDTAAAHDRALVSYAGSGEETLRRAEIGLRDIASPNTPDGSLSGPILTEKQGINRLPITIFEDHARLDIRVLASKGLFRPHEITPLLLDWGDTAAEVDGVHGFIDLSAIDEAFLALEYVCQGELSYQKIRLEYCGTGRPGWRVVCPATGREGHVLVFRAGRFASRQAQRLVNRSQRVSKPSKASSESL